MLKANGGDTSAARKLGIAALFGAAFFAALLVTAAAQDAASQDVPPITPAQLSLVEDMVKGTVGHDQTFLAQPVTLLGLHGTIGRQMSGQDNAGSTETHFFTLFASDPGAIVLIYLKSNMGLRAYRIDERFRFVLGYTSDKSNVDVPMPLPDGAPGVQAELKWWSSAASRVIQDAQKALASGQSAADVARGYGVSAATLSKWLAAAK
jgi:hypothetical protein